MDAAQVGQAVAVIGPVLGVLANVPGALRTGKLVKDWVIEVFGIIFGPNPPKAQAELGNLTQFIHQLGMTTQAEVERVVADWPSPPGFTDAQRAELTVVLKKLVQGARFHTTHAITLSNYLTAEQLLAKLFEAVEPKMHQGQRLDGWVLTKYLGMGGFGEVWLAEHKLFHEPQVYKFFTRDGAAEWLSVEAMALRSVWQKLSGSDCPNIIKYLNVNLEAKPYPYLVLEYGQLGTLDDWILTKPREAREAKIGDFELMKGIVRGVSDAHKQQIHHRDLKPANILLTGTKRDVVPKIADFGLSVDAAAAKPNAPQTVLVGTTMYLPPEAAIPTAPRNPAQDDVFALGVIWFQVLTGHLTRPSYDFAEELALAGADSRSIKLIGKCLASPKNRFPSACELYDEIDKVEPPPGPGEWDVPEGCFDVAGIAREYLERTCT
jgi:hypothetical protein